MILAPFATALAEPALKQALRRPTKTVAEGTFAGEDFQPGILRRRLVSVDFGDHTYPLRRQTDGCLEPYHEGEAVRWSFVVPSMGFLEGHGGTPREAIEDYQEVFHCNFQRLYVKRPFEMSEDDRQQWLSLISLVDVDAYRRSQPVTIRRFGVAYMDQGRRYVRWEGRTGKEPIDLRSYPAEFANYRSGQSFEAIVEIDPRTNATKRVQWSTRQDTVSPMEEEEAREFWNSLPGLPGLPELPEIG